MQSRFGRSPLPTHPWNQLSTGPNVEQAPDVIAERIVFWTIALVPLWWILGIQVIVYPIVGWFLFYRSLGRRNRVTLPFGWQLWVLYVGVWLLSMLINLTRGTAEVGRSVTAFGSITGVWALMVVTWYAVRQLNVRYPVVVRAICVLGVCQLAVALLGETYSLVTGSVLETESLVLTLIPNMPAAVFFEAKLYSFERLTWDSDPITRIRSFYYWAPLAGTMGMLVCMGCLGERNRLWKVLAFAGGLVTLWLSTGRAAQLAFVLAILVVLWCGSRRGRQLLLWSLPVLIITMPFVMGEIYDYIFNFRTDSTTGRIALYEETFKAFVHSPWFGFGAQGRSQVLDVPLGSHSQILSTLYQTGLIGSFILLIAWIALAIALLRLVQLRPQLAPVLGAWTGLSLVMLSGELAAASVTIFVLATWIGCSWNLIESQLRLRQTPWLANTPLFNPPTPWESLGNWWSGTNSYRPYR